MERDSTTMFTPGTSVIHTHSTGAAALGQVIGWSECGDTYHHITCECDGKAVVHDCASVHRLSLQRLCEQNCRYVVCHGMWGMGHSFGDKLYFTRDMPEGKWVPKDLLAPISAKCPSPTEGRWFFATPGDGCQMTVPHHPLGNRTTAVHTHYGAQKLRQRTK